MKRAVRWTPELGIFSVRDWDGKIRARDQNWFDSMMCSDSTRLVMNALLKTARDNPGSWVEYPGDSQ